MLAKTIHSQKFRSKLRNCFKSINSTSDVNDRVASWSNNSNDFDLDSETELLDELIPIKNSIKQYKVSKAKSLNDLNKLESNCTLLVNLQADLEAARESNESDSQTF